MTYTVEDRLDVIKLAFQLAQSGFQDRLAARVASAGRAGQDAAADRAMIGTSE